MVSRRDRAAALALGLAGAMLAGVAPAAAQVQVDARLEPGRIALGETVDLVIEVSASGLRTDIADPVLPDLGPIEILGRSAQRGVRMSGTRVTRHATFRYTLLPAAPGTLRLEPARVQVDGEVYATPLRRILVVDATGTIPAWRGQPDEAPPPGGPPAIFAATRLDRETAWLGQQVTLTFAFYHDPSLPLSESPDYDPPDTPGFWRIELDDAPLLSTERIGGRLYHVQRFRYALFPLRTGELEIGPATVRVREPDPTRWWTPGQPRTILTDPLTLVARTLPAGAPPGFDGAIGRFDISGGPTDRQPAVGAPFQLELTVRGTGNPASVPAPVLPEWPDVTVQPPAVESATTTRDQTVAGQKTFRWLLVPRTEGPLELGVARLPYFDPAAGAFAVDTVRLGELVVAAGAPLEGNATRAESGPTLWPPRQPSASRLEGLAGSPWYWGALAGPWLAWLGLLGARRVRGRPREDPAATAWRARLERAAADLREGDPEAPGRAAAAIERCLSAVWGAGLAGAAPAERRARMEQAGVPPRVVEAAAAARAAVTDAAYGGHSGAEAAMAVERLAAALPEPSPRTRGGTVPAILLMGILAASGATPADAAQEEAWADANRAYRSGEFSVAAEGYRRILSRTDDPRLRADLAAALWGAGERGAAVAQYVSALASAPRESTIRADLERLRAELGEPPAGPTVPAPLDRVRLDEILAALLMASWLGAAAVLAARGRRPAVAAVALGAVLALSGLAALHAAAGRGERAAVAAPAAEIAGQPAGAPIARLPEGAVVRVLERAGDAWRVRAEGFPAGWVASKNLVPLD